MSGRHLFPRLRWLGLAWLAVLSVLCDPRCRLRRLPFSLDVGGDAHRCGAPLGEPVGVFESGRSSAGHRPRLVGGDAGWRVVTGRTCSAVSGMSNVAVLRLLPPAVALCHSRWPFSSSCWCGWSLFGMGMGMQAGIAGGVVGLLPPVCRAGAPTSSLRIRRSSFRRALRRRRCSYRHHPGRARGGWPTGLAPPSLCCARRRQAHVVDVGLPASARLRRDF